MELSELMNLRPGITALIGGSGKTSFLQAAGEELSKTHSVLLCTTTELIIPENAPVGSTREELSALANDHSLVWGGIRKAPGKLAPLEIPLSELEDLFSYILIKADSTHGRPLAAHMDNPPPIPQEANQVICLVGASGFGQEIQEAVWNYACWTSLADVAAESPITPELAAELLKREGLYHRVFVNQVEAVEQLAWVGRFASCRDCPVAAGSLLSGTAFPCN